MAGLFTSGRVAAPSPALVAVNASG